MQLVEQHVIHKGDSRYVTIDQAAFASKNLYNLANYHMRQFFIHTGKYMEYAEVYHLVKQSDAYKSLPRKVSNDVLRLLGKNWKAYRKALAAWHENPTAFLGRPCLPKYKDKKHGRNILIYDIQALSKQERYMGKRVKRGLFRSASGRRINADVNGSLNIIRKAIPDSFSGKQGIEGVAVRPVGTPTY